MVDEVDGQLLCDGVVVADGVGPDGGPLVAREVAADCLHVQRAGVVDALEGEQHLHVGVGVVVAFEVPQSGASRHDADHVRGDAFGPQHS